MDTSVNQTKLQWQGDWRTTLFVAVFLPLFVGLGMWQLGRAEEKVVIAQTWEQRASSAALELAQLPASAPELAYQPVTLRGSYLPDRQFLLDNRMQQGKYGLELIAMFRDQSGVLVAVNRGWLAGDPARRQLPTFDTPGGSQVLRGSIYVPPGEAYILGEAMSGEAWPRVLQALDNAAMSRAMGEAVYPFTVRLDGANESALVTDWPLINVSPEKHTGYAVQWFSMALALLLLYLWRSTNLMTWWRERKEQV